MSLSAFLRELAGASLPQTVFHPWRDHDPVHDLSPASPAHRLEHLTAYLTARLQSAKLLIIAEAPGYRGCKFSGIPMTSERALLQDSPLLAPSPHFDGPKHRTSNPKAPLVAADGMIEPTASIVWAALGRLSLSPRNVVLWNCYAFHPFQAGDRMSNRTPQDGEIEAALPILRAFLDVFPGVPTVAVGRKAEVWLKRMDVAALPARHPANGGASLFNRGLDAAVASMLPIRVARTAAGGVGACGAAAVPA